MRVWLIATALLVASAFPLFAQRSETLVRARAAYDSLDYAEAIRGAQAALREPLGRDDRVGAYELLGFSYGALDSTRAAVASFRQLIFLAPDREPDVERVSPRITSLYASALGQVLVVRRVTLDSASFVAGAGSARLHYEVSRLALTSTRLVGPNLDVILDTQTVAGPAFMDWRVTDARGGPLPAGQYDLIVTAREEARSEYASPLLRVQVTHGAVDTVPHLASLPGYQPQPEVVPSPRDWRPLALSALYAGIGIAAGLALDREALGTGPRTALLTVSAGTVTTGLALSLRRPDPRPSPTNILYNRLLAELLARRNAEIARDNAARRSEVLLRVHPVRP